MIRKFVKTLAVTLTLVAAFALSQSVALADIPDNLKFTGTNQGFSMDGVYTSPYQITINNATSALLLACDDFSTETATTWQAQKINLDQVAVDGPQKFKDSGVTIDDVSKDYTIVQKYNAAAWLTEQLLTRTNLSNPRWAGQYSFAIWQIFSSAAITHLTNQEDKAAVNDKLRAAFDPARTALTHSVYLYTPKPLDSSQEFIGISDSLTINSVPEASTTAFLAFNFLALPCFLSVVRRRYRGASK